MLKKAHAFLLLIFILSVFQAKTVLGKDEAEGFYAGPLSVTAETVAEAANNSKDTISEADKIQEENF